MIVGTAGGIGVTKEEDGDMCGVEVKSEKLNEGDGDE